MNRQSFYTHQRAVTPSLHYSFLSGTSWRGHRYESRLACSADWSRYIGISPNGIRQVGGLPIRDIPTRRDASGPVCATVAAPRCAPFFRYSVPLLAGSAAPARGAARLVQLLAGAGSVNTLMRRLPLSNPTLPST